MIYKDGILDVLLIGIVKIINTKLNYNNHQTVNYLYLQDVSKNM